ncbi:MAG: universal stress protein [Sphingopyxis sp.]
MTRRVRPKSILLATDLSSRCDRALSRAAQLAAEWEANLIAATVVEAEPDQLMDQREREPRTTPAERALRTLESHLTDVKIRAEAHVASGNPASVLRSVAEQNNFDLIIMGTARNEALPGLLLGGTTKQLMKTLSAPVLIVHDRPAGPYRNILVATDRSQGAREALFAAARFFPKARITLFNAHDFPAASNLGANERAKHDMDLRSEMLAEIIADPRVSTDLAARLELVVETGAVERLVSEYAQDHAVDLTVVGSHGHGAIFEAVIGSTERKLLDSHAGDLLIVSSKEG